MIDVIRQTVKIVDSLIGQTKEVEPEHSNKQGVVFPADMT